MSSNSEYRIITPPSGIIKLNLNEMITYREVLFSLVSRHVTLRYHDSIFGSVYAIILPLFNMIIFTFLFGYIAKISTGEVPYSIFSYSGLILWVFFSTAVSGASGSIISNAGLLTKIYFPRIFYPLTPCIGGLFDYLISFFILIVLLSWYGLIPSASLLFLPLIIFGVFALSIGLGCILASVTVYFRDMTFITQPLLQILMFTSPVVYPMSAIPHQILWAISLNPMTGFINAHRQCLLGQPIDIVGLGLSLGFAIIVLIIGIAYLRKTEIYFADLI